METIDYTDKTDAELEEILTTYFGVEDDHYGRPYWLAASAEMARRLAV